MIYTAKDRILDTLTSCVTSSREETVSSADRTAVEMIPLNFLTSKPYKITPKTLVYDFYGLVEEWGTLVPPVGLNRQMFYHGFSKVNANGLTFGFLFSPGPRILFYFRLNTFNPLKMEQMGTGYIIAAWWVQGWSARLWTNIHISAKINTPAWTWGRLEMWGGTRQCWKNSAADGSLSIGPWTLFV